MYIEVKATTLLSVDLKAEIDWLKTCLTATNSPIVFSHNDFRGPNIMVREGNEKDSQSIDITLCDFEYSCYSYRGFDFGAIFEDWGRTSVEEVNENISDSVLKRFMKSYLEESIQINGNNYRDNSVNTIDHLVGEAKQRADQRLQYYLTLKSKCIEEGLIRV
ncbi:unnamed protein product [Oppiella nova]|uniref:Uncharacterized protein n=1 Tax=Oppiella nova TaxID=334625 RepID=A0A7R9QZB3_9ACAR|nr:unnamed protein product [Oppiella nova]CAG2180415.1 unnamed protein product [Oppiella nova]